jgi:hypothetical protein
MKGGVRPCLFFYFSSLVCFVAISAILFWSDFLLLFRDVFVTSVGAISILAAQTLLIDVMLTRVEYGGALLIGLCVAHKALFFL